MPGLIFVWAVFLGGTGVAVIAARIDKSLSDEPGCRQFDICTDPSRPDEVFLYEIYDDRAAFDAHLDAAHFKQFDKAVAELIAEKTVKTYLSVRQ
ncbi:MAG: putative quinol monooxygenase [Pseudomonadota bacterium]